MLRSLFAGVSGLRNHQVRMDVIGNNVANVNTVAFKSGRVTFKEGFAQLVAGASRPPGDNGGTNPIQIGLGSQIGSVDNSFSQGNIETTGINTDLALQGDSFFVVAKGNQPYYTRSGNFQLDADGRLVSPTNGFVVQGRMATNGVYSEGVTDIRLPFGQRTAAKPSSNVRLAGNLDASAPVFQGDPMSTVDRQNPANVGAYKDTTITLFDSLGAKHELKVTQWKTANNEWQWQLDPASLGLADADITSPANNAPQTFTFDTLGQLDTSAPGWTPPVVAFDPGNGADPISLTMDPRGDGNGLTQFAGENSVVLREQDGYTEGTLQDFTIDRSGRVMGAFSNGTTVELGQIVLADFNNPSGLLRVGDNMYGTSGNSGAAVLGFALEGATSTVVSGALEMSNVDLAQEFTSLIVAQRGFQANGRMITTSDQMLEEVVSLKR